MTGNFVRLLTHFRRHDLVGFIEKHHELFTQAKKNNDHAAVTAHYYSVMSKVIDEYFSGSFHFVPPMKEKQKLEESLYDLHQRIGKELELGPGVRCLDIGCGIGSVISELAHTGAQLTGVTIAKNEVEIGNATFEQQGVNETCRLIEADCHKMPFEDASFDCGYAIYSLKYFSDLEPIFKEIARVLKPGGRFVVYDLVKTSNYDESCKEHVKTVKSLEYACGMPSLHFRDELIEKAQQTGLPLLNCTDLSEEVGRPFHYSFSKSQTFMWMINSKTIGRLIKVAQFLKIMPKGFYLFNKVFLSGTVSNIVKGGKLGILSGSEILVFQKHPKE
ncbi:Methyltransferase type 11 domain containing protein [Aphelenchoides bicaudatus]|nr:Methyltransferase type 11 domain containing protein [Aphelenchoides bicaudatus]